MTMPYAGVPVDGDGRPQQWTASRWTQAELAAGLAGRGPVKGQAMVQIGRDVVLVNFVNGVATTGTILAATPTAKRRPAAPKVLSWRRGDHNIPRAVGVGAALGLCAVVCAMLCGTILAAIAFAAVGVLTVTALATLM